MSRFEPDASTNTPHKWDGLFRSTNTATYLGNTIEIDARNHIISTLLKFRTAPSPSVLDLGCCGGTLATALTSYSRYLGLDISPYAIGEARKDPALSHSISSGRASFDVADLRSYEPDTTWDVIIFSEVLYYLKTDEALEMVARYARALSPSGVVVISMKDDAKSSAIFAKVSKRFTWVDGMLSQRKPAKADYRTRISRECPGHLVGVLTHRFKSAGD